MPRKAPTVAASDVLAPTLNASSSDSTSEQEDLSVPAGMCAVTAASSAKGNMPLRYPAHPECDEDMTYEAWCIREVARLTRKGRIAMVVYGIRKGLTVCQVVANTLEPIQSMQSETMIAEEKSDEG